MHKNDASRHSMSEEKFKEAVDMIMKASFPIAIEAMRKYGLMGYLAMLHSPFYLIMNLIQKTGDDDMVKESLGIVPDIFIRMAHPWQMLKPKWGNMPVEEFMKEWDKLYRSQSDS
jgi:hypothetical protein